MNIEDINLGDPPTGAGGDTMRTAFGKTNQNFGAAKQALEDEVQTREQLLETQRDQLIALIESMNGPLPALRADLKVPSFGSKNGAGLFLPCGYSDLFSLSAPSPQSVWNSKGQLIQVPAGQPAFDHDPATGEPLGQRITTREATNYIANTDITTWNVRGGTNVSVVKESSDKFFDGEFVITENGARERDTGVFIQTTANDDGFIAYAAIKSDDAKIVSFAFIPGTSSSIYCAYDLELGQVVQDAARCRFVSAEPVGDGFTLITVKLDPGGAPTAYNDIYIFFSSDSDPYGGLDTGHSVRIAMPQVDTGLTPSSFIPTAGNAVMRAADYSESVAPFEAAFNPSRFTLFFDYEDLASDNTLFGAYGPTDVNTGMYVNRTSSTGRTALRLDDNGAGFSISTETNDGSRPIGKMKVAISGSANSNTVVFAVNESSNEVTDPVVGAALANISKLWWCKSRPRSDPNGVILLGDFWVDEKLRSASELEEMTRS